MFGPPSPSGAPWGPTPPPAPPGPVEQAQELQRLLIDVVRRANRHGGRMPPAGLPAIHEVEDELRPLLEHLTRQPATAVELIPIRAIVADHLPTTLDRFVALPPEFTTRYRTESGVTPAEEFLTQLGLLAHAARECADAVYAGDARELSAQGSFLQTKFTRSDLDLDR